MKAELEAAERLIRDLRVLITRCGWAGNDPDLVLDGVVSILMRHLATGRPLSEIVNETVPLATLRSLPDIEAKLILNTLIFLYDPTLMERSRDLLSHSAADLHSAPPGFLVKVTELLKKRAGDYPPGPVILKAQPKEPAFGVSVVLAFEYPKEFIGAVNKAFEEFPLLPAHCKPIPRPPGAYITSQMHFTLLNAGLDMSRPDADRLVDAVAASLQRLLRADYAVRRPVETMCSQAQVRPSFRLMVDGSLMLLGSGAKFLSSFCDFRQAVFPVVARLRSTSAAYNIWMHTVYARPAEALTAKQIEVLSQGANAIQTTFPSDARMPMTGAKLAIITFDDGKAITPPASMLCYDLDHDVWRRCN